MEELAGGVAVVTGAGSGIGRALARRFGAEGMRVVAADVEAGALDETVRLLTDAGTEATALRTDVSCCDDVVALADHAYERFGAVDVLCNNAGVFAGGLMWECSEADFRWVLEVNLWGILHAIRVFVPRMLAQDTEGAIVDTVSAAGLCATPYSGAYTLSKFAAMAATESLAHELRAVGSKLQVHALTPSAVNTRIGESGRNRRDEPGPRVESAVFVEQVLRDTTAAGLDPDAVAGMVVDAIRSGEFLVPTRPSYATQLTERYEALLRRELPPVPFFD